MRSKEVYTTTRSAKATQQKDSGAKTRLGIRDQVKLVRHRGVSQGFIYIGGSEPRSEYKCETVNEAKYSTGSRKHDGGKTYESYGSVI